jgi:hypothetical protein
MKLSYVSTYMGGLRKTILNISQDTWLKFMVNTECPIQEISWSVLNVLYKRFHTL